MTDVMFNLDTALEDNLTTFRGKRVNLVLSSGNVLSGVLKEVNNGLVHLEKIIERNYFDALIRVDKIVAFETQFRGFNQ